MNWEKWFFRCYLAGNSECIVRGINNSWDMGSDWAVVGLDKFGIQKRTEVWAQIDRFIGRSSRSEIDRFVELSSPSQTRKGDVNTSRPNCCFTVWINVSWSHFCEIHRSSFPLQSHSAEPKHYADEYFIDIHTILLHRAVFKSQQSC
jgi:hypothetical protein